MPIAPILGSNQSRHGERERKPTWPLPHKPLRSLLVSLADKTHNAETILFDYQQEGEALWARFTGGADGTRWYYQSLAKTFSEVLPGRLADRLARAIREFA